jgi:hypothetical protein
VLGNKLIIKKSTFDHTSFEINDPYKYNFKIVSVIEALKVVLFFLVGIYFLGGHTV